jgi:hypothetical protein
LGQPAAHPDGRIRRPGGGRKKAKQKDPTLVVDLEKLVDSTTRGDPECCLRWTCKSVRKLAEELGQLGHAVSYPVVAKLLHELDYSLQATGKPRKARRITRTATRSLNTSTPRSSSISVASNR